MMNRGQCAIVLGYHACNYPPDLAHEAGLGNRFAVIFSTADNERGYAHLDPLPFTSIARALCAAIPHDSLVIERGNGGEFRAFGDFTKESLRCNEDFEPFKRVLLFQQTRLVELAETEEWINIGGPSPYHDSYTLALYTELDRSDDFLRVCRKGCCQYGLSVADVYVAQKEGAI